MTVLVSSCKPSTTLPPRTLQHSCPTLQFCTYHPAHICTNSDDDCPYGTACSTAQVLPTPSTSPQCGITPPAQHSTAHGAESTWHITFHLAHPRTHNQPHIRTPPFPLPTPIALPFPTTSAHSPPKKPTLSIKAAYQENAEPVWTLSALSWLCGSFLIQPSTAWLRQLSRIVSFG